MSKPIYTLVLLALTVYVESRQNCVDRDFCSALQNSGKKCDAELKELCPVYCGLCEDDDEVPLPRQGGQRRHGEDRHTKEDYLPHGKECENNPYKRDYNPCKEGWYCADDDLCNSGGLDCCKPKLQLDDICDDHKDCQDGLYCADKRDVGGRYDLCRPVPKKYSHLTICDKDYDCPKQEFCDERNCPREFDADCCGEFRDD